MPNRKTKPTSPGRRFATYPLREQVTAKEPEKKLTEGLKKSGGRNSNGRSPPVTVAAAPSGATGKSTSSD